MKWMLLCCNMFLFIFPSTDVDSPKDLKASDLKLDSASLSWIPPLADIDGYILTYRDEEGKLEVLYHYINHKYALLKEIQKLFKTLQKFFCFGIMECH